ncbi:MAG: HEPN domain-containing protein [Pseudobacter sp.]|uniref:HEPN domain-containing protein n=1 Tax=Pseudobacter sp. TaxID=2045420 RepID=UPI003F7FE38A
MQPSFDQLPEKKQHEIRQVVEVIKEVIDPEMVILFGSYAKGTWVDHQYHSGGLLNEYTSDYDFLVVTQTSEKDAYVLEHQVIQKTDHFNPPVNLEIHGIDHINKGLEWGEYFWADIIKEGIVLFDKRTIQFSQPRELTPLERKEKAQRYFDTWFPQANEFLIDAKHAADRKNFKKSDFELHQAAENLYYATLTVFTDYKPKLHNLWKLRKKAKPYSEQLYLVFRTETDKSEENLFELLKQGYIEARYDPKFSISEENINILIERVSSMIPIVEQICKTRIESL